MAQQQYDNTNRGALFKNDRKTKDSQPDYTGKIELGKDVLDAAARGEAIFLSAWVKEIKTGQRAGTKMLSLSIQPPNNNAKGGAGPQSPRDKARNRDVQNPVKPDDEQFKDEDIPF